MGGLRGRFGYNTVTRTARATLNGSHAFPPDFNQATKEICEECELGFGKWFPLILLTPSLPSRNGSINGRVVTSRNCSRNWACILVITSHWKVDSYNWEWYSELLPGKLSIRAHECKNISHLWKYNSFTCPNKLIHCVYHIEGGDTILMCHHCNTVSMMSVKNHNKLLCVLRYCAPHGLHPNQVHGLLFMLCGWCLCACWLGYYHTTGNDRRSQSQNHQRPLCRGK